MKINNLSSVCKYIAIVFLFYCCNNQGLHQNSKTEKFEVFRERFFSDSIFQRSRITFPLPGLNTNDMEMDDTVYYWKENHFFMIKELNIKDLKKKIIRNNSTIIEKYFLEDSGFMVEYYFKLVDRKWYLVRFEYVNT